MANKKIRIRLKAYEHRTLDAKIKLQHVQVLK